METSEATITDLLIQQARVEGKIDALIASLGRHDESIDALFRRTNEHSRKLASAESALEILSKTHDNSVSRGLVIASLMISALTITVTVIFNLVK